MARDNDASAFVLGLLLGTAAGVAVTLFTAPCSGAETIDQLRRRANRLLGRAEDAATRAYDWATAPMREARQDWPGGLYDTGLADDEPLPAELQEVVDAFDAAPTGEDLLDQAPQYVDASTAASAGEDLLDELASTAEDIEKGAST